MDLQDSVHSKRGSFFMTGPLRERLRKKQRRKNEQRRTKK